VKKPMKPGSAVVQRDTPASSSWWGGSIPNLYKWLSPMLRSNPAHCSHWPELYGPQGWVPG
jgi:hypothetical protein